MTALRAANLALRLLLELAALLAAGHFGFSVVAGPVLNWLVGIGLPVAMAAAWGVFRIADDGGSPVIEVRGHVRFALEAVFFAVAVGGLFAIGRPEWAATLLVLLIVNYGIDYRRTLDLLLGRR